MNPKLHECVSKDSLREAMQYALVNKKEVVATNANVLVVHDTEELFDASLVEAVPEDGILVSVEALKSIAKPTFVQLIYYKEEKEVRVLHTKSIETFPVKLNNEGGLNFPKYANLFDDKPKWNGEKVEVGINAKLLQRVSNGLGAIAGVRLTINSPSHAIVVHNKMEDSLYPTAKGLVMPMLLDY